MKTKRTITAGSLIVLGASYIPMIGPTVTNILAFQLGPVTVGAVVGAVAVVSGLLLVKKEM